MAQRTRILLLVSHLGGGGAEHVMALLARGLSQEKYEVHLGIVGQADASGESLPPWVNVHALGAGRARAAAFPLLRLVWRLRPAVVLSGAAEVSFLVLLLRPLFPPRTSRAGAPERDGVVGPCIRQAAAIHTPALSTALSPRGSCDLPVAAQWRRIWRKAAAIGEEQIAVLPNPVDLEGIRTAMQRSGQRKAARARNCWRWEDSPGRKASTCC